MVNNYCLQFQHLSFIDAYISLGFALAFTASWQIALVVLACFPLVIFTSVIQMNKLSGDHSETDGPSASDGNNKQATVTQNKKNASTATTVRKSM